MRGRTVQRAWLLGLICLTAAAAWADGDGGLPEWLERTRVSGEIFGDAYYMAWNHDSTIDDANGFWIRRINLSLDSKLADDFSARLRFEANSPGDFKSNDRLVPYVKDAWVKWQGGQAAVQFGLFGTPTWATVEQVWGYRPVEKTPVELQRLGNSRDLGVGVEGKGASGKLHYAVMAGNGADTRGETNEGKKVYGAVGYRPGKAWVVEAYADFESRPDDADRTTVQGFAAWKGEGARAGLLYARQHRGAAADGDELDLDMVSVFAVARVHARVSLLGRFDRLMDPNPDGAGIAYLPFATTTESNLVIAGVDLRLVDAVHVIPNVEYVRYDGPDRPDDDLIVRLTGLWSF